MYSTSDVTIIIPAYCPTQESLVWFEECLESALVQGCYVSIASDASPKAVYEIVHDLWDSRISFCRMPEHVGVSAARNIATVDVQTKLIFPLDGDDTLRIGAIQELVDIYEGIPLYPDVRKFGEENIPHYQLLDFNCDHLYKKVGLASVGVLHEKEQWKTVGGWNEYIDFYEDGEYNARLMLTYCGKHYPFPLINYRIHSGQRTKTNKGRSVAQIKKILAVIQEHPNMCCGKNKRRGALNEGASLAAVSRSSKMNISSLPGTQGERVLVLYTGGKGGAKHYYKGPATNYPYKVKHGEYYYVDPKDAKMDGDVLSRSLFIRVVRSTDKIKETEVTPASEQRTARTAVAKDPVESTPMPVRPPLPDIRNLKWAAEIRHMDFAPDEAAKLLKIEKEGQGRVRVMNHLKKFIEKS